MADKERIATEEELAEDSIAVATDMVAFTRIDVDCDGERYTLEFNRSTVKRMEREGFDIDRIESAPVSTIESLVDGAFEMHHPSMPHAARMRVWDSLGGKGGEGGLVRALITLYMAPVNSLVADPTTSTATWKLV